jgi:predicted GNAT family acetyltransferase
MSGTAPLVVTHNAQAQRFEARVDGELCRADYRLQDGVMRIHHTEVPYRFNGLGYAAQVVAAAMAHAREHGLRVVPACSYVRAYMKRHPETHDLLPPASQG